MTTPRHRRTATTTALALAFAMAVGSCSTLHIGTSLVSSPLSGVFRYPTSQQYSPGASPGGPAGLVGENLPPVGIAQDKPAASGQSLAGTAAATGTLDVASKGPTAWVSGTISAPGGPYLTDRYGRVVFFHGVNAVYKRPPYELTVTPGNPWTFDATDASRIASLGFNVVRLGILWEGIEPGHGGPNQPAVCAPGAPGNPHQFDPAVAAAYLARVAQVVDLLGRYHVYTILDMHQDVFSQAFGGEGAPAWAVCTGKVPIFVLGGRWSHNYANPGLAVASQHFWLNNTVGGLQSQFDLVWSVTAQAFAANPWVLGYDPYNEPFSLHETVDEATAFATDLECFYTGTGGPGRIEPDVPLRCPSTDPSRGVIPTIEAADPHHLVLVEPDIFTVRAAQRNLLGPMNFPRLVWNIHSYCGYRSPVTGNPTNLSRCFDQAVNTIDRRQAQRASLATPAQPGGPAWFLTEFGATRSSALLDAITGYTDALQLSWAYWSWKYYNDPTGSRDEALVSSSGALEPTAAALSRTYPEAVAGSVQATSFDPTSGAFLLRYVASPKIRDQAPTVVFVAPIHYPHGYCTRTVGGQIVSSPGAHLLLVRNATTTGTVTVSVTAGPCG